MMQKFNPLELMKARRNQATSAVLMALASFNAHAAGLSKAKGALDGFLAELHIIVPVVATIVLICLALAYSWRMIQKDTLVQWGVGIVIAGSAAEIVAVFLN